MYELCIENSYLQLLFINHYYQIQIVSEPHNHYILKLLYIIYYYNYYILKPCNYYNRMRMTWTLNKPTRIDIP